MPAPIQLQERQAEDSARAARLPLWAGICLLLLIVLGVARIVTTYKEFSQTSDEPAHLASGMDWLDLCRYDYERLHPPLARAMLAVGPFAAGVRSTGRIWMWGEGTAELWSGGHYLRNLALARMGVLPFFVLLLLVAFEWSRRISGNAGAVLTVLLLSTLPPLLAHSGLATTDVPFAAMGVVALYAFSRWLERPTLKNAVLVGLAAGLAVVTKFSALVFLPVGFAAMWFTARPRSDAKRPRQSPLVHAAVAAIAVMLVIWSIYHFRYHTRNGKALVVAHRFEFIVGSNTVPEILFDSFTQHLPLPDDFARGLRELWLKSQGVEPGYILGRMTHGAWYFFPVALAVKTPIPFLILAIGGIVLLFRRPRSRQDLLPFAAAIAILLASMFATLNIGLRHVLILYPLLAICAGATAAHRWKHPRAALTIIAALLAWQVVSSAIQHPRYLSYFNAFAGSHPERILVDSDLDWGQDALHLRDLLRQRGIQEVWIDYFGTTDLQRLGMPKMHFLFPDQHPAGWIAISQQYLQTKSGYAWLKKYQPTARAGDSILLYDMRPHSQP